MNFSRTATTVVAPAPDKMDCSSCGGAAEKRVSNSAKNPGREYWRCTACNNFCGWTDGTTSGGGGGGFKRARGGGGAPQNNALQTELADLKTMVAALDERITNIENALIGDQ